MLRVKISNVYPSWPIQRQTPGSSGVWGDIEYHINSDIKECDFWVVCEGVSKEEVVTCSPENTLLLTTEPPTVKKYENRFINQFHHVISPHKNLKHKNVIHCHQGLPWMVGGKYQSNNGWLAEFEKDYDELKAITQFKKDKLMSVVLSKKDLSAGHIQKYNFALALKNHFGDQVDVFGVGINAVEDKWDAIYPYKYHLVLENCSIDDYWTEKLSDCYLAGAFPFYYGCPNLNTYFENGAFIQIDINDIEGAIALIEDAILRGVFETSTEAITRSREKVLDEYNLFALLEKYIKSNYSKKESVDVRIVPEASLVRMRWSNHLIGTVRNFKKRLFG